MQVIGYKYNSEADAISAQEQIDNHFNLPYLDTLHWKPYYKTSDDNPEFWYIIYSEDVLDILGQPETFEVTVPQDV